MAEILTSIHGRECGLDADGNLVLNKADGTQVILSGGGAEVITFAALNALAPADYAGSTFFVPDVGLHGSLWRSDGATWGIVGGSVEYVRSAVAQTPVTGNTALNTVVTIPIPGGLPGPNGAFEVWLKWTLTNNANAKTAYVYLGGSPATGIGMPSALSFGCRALIENRNSQALQIGSNGTSHGYAATTTAWAFPTIDTSVATSITIRMQLGVGTDSATLESYSVRLIRP